MEENKNVQTEAGSDFDAKKIESDPDVTIPETDKED